MATRYAVRRVFPRTWNRIRFVDCYQGAYADESLCSDVPRAIGGPSPSTSRMSSPSNGVRRSLPCDRDMTVQPTRQRLHEHAREWNVVVKSRKETESSLMGFGVRGDQQVVLKVARREGEEWRSG